ncbi:MAG: lactate utilization protein [Acidaminococcaceae bacterium]|nr:lactate utilization protein [Acidaminococcaceae bacterium]
MDLLHDHYAKQGEKLVETLNKRMFQAQYVSTKEEALAAVLALVGDKDTVGMGGSRTLEEIKVKEALLASGHMVYNHQGLSAAEAHEVRRQEMLADVFLASSNAITLDGQLINVDGTGNRVAAMIFGPKRVILVIGANKIVRDEAAGRERIKMLAAPMNTARLGRKTPCALTGTCMNCGAATSICRATSIIHYPLSGSDFHIILVGETLGF